ncbi:uncharacterized protein LOC103515841 [Diaphorina citri]|uniref:Uncharacterized protein LOC103515841 n=1 Tax=Diaphorina citri TaxID=121845 RepID=A0A3Q0J6X3_DIACI|nr:uncharacterized protein LOC103515841 [Diaphorina citri]
MANEVLKYLSELYRLVTVQDDYTTASQISAVVCNMESLLFPCNGVAPHGSDLDVYMSNIFNPDNGLPAFITKYFHVKTIRPCFDLMFGLILKLLLEYNRRVVQYVAIIKDVCMKAILSGDTTAQCKAKCYACLEKIITSLPGNFSLQSELNAEVLTNQLFNHLAMSRSKLQTTDVHSIYTIFGLLGKDFSSELCAPDKLIRAVCNELNSKEVKAGTAKIKIVESCLTALSNLLSNPEFKSLVLANSSHQSKIYSALKSTLVPNKRVHTAFRACLKLFADHTDVFSSLLIPEYALWHSQLKVIILPLIKRYLITCLKLFADHTDVFSSLLIPEYALWHSQLTELLSNFEGEEDNRAIEEALDKFYVHVATFVSEQAKGFRYFTELLSNFEGEEDNRAIEEALDKFYVHVATFVSEQGGIQSVAIYKYFMEYFEKEMASLSTLRSTNVSGRNKNKLTIKGLSRFVECNVAGNDASRQHLATMFHAFLKRTLYLSLELQKLEQSSLESNARLVSHYVFLLSHLLAKVTTQVPSTRGTSTQVPGTQGGAGTLGSGTQGISSRESGIPGSSSQRISTKRAINTEDIFTQDPTTQGISTQGVGTQGTSTQRTGNQGPRTLGTSTQGPGTSGTGTQKASTQGISTGTQGFITQGPSTQVSTQSWNSFLSICLNLVSLYPRLDYRTAAEVSSELTQSLVSLWKKCECDGAVNGLIREFVYQSVIQTCSHDLAFDADNLPNQSLITYRAYLPLWRHLLSRTETKLQRLEQSSLESNARLVSHYVFLLSHLLAKVTTQGTSTQVPGTQGGAGTLGSGTQGISSLELQKLEQSSLESNARLVSHYVFLLSHLLAKVTTQVPTTQGPGTQGGAGTLGSGTQGISSRESGIPGSSSQRISTKGAINTEDIFTQDPTTQGISTQGVGTQGTSTQRTGNQGPRTLGTSTQGPVKTFSLKILQLKESPLKESALKELVHKEPAIKDIELLEPALKALVLQEPALKESPPALKDLSLKDLPFKDLSLKDPALKSRLKAGTQFGEPVWNSFLSICLNLVSLYPRLDYRTAAEVSSELTQSLVSLWKKCGCDGAVNGLVREFVYQSVIQTCSHDLAFDADNLPNQSLITYRAYLPLWRHLLSRTETLCDDSSFGDVIVNELMTSLLIFCHKLDLGANLKPDSELSNKITGGIAQLETKALSNCSNTTMAKKQKFVPA